MGFSVIGNRYRCVTFCVGRESLVFLPLSRTSPRTWACPGCCRDSGAPN
ncbi:hypothetical protein C900_02930 [Fulvivirga imtechensis AK7]|uniref:Uncharacterized protein n=1 Tax=Fulvivirga imtechensis AK7 TaxID=1237149 RepID=L8JR34_9BACT|nr:hypothetical protein C900_02930 [Fulvivirga imtechensis AK7]